MMPLRSWLSFAFLLLAFDLAIADGIPEPAGYRLDHYRAPLPSTLHGAEVVNALTLHKLMESQAIIVIDVLPQPPRPEKLPADTIWHPPARLDIPGSVWLANTGYGALSPEMERFFRNALERLTFSNKNRPLAFYCEAQCWMSWNAAKRALSYGYRHVHWFPGGVQEWIRQGYPTLPNLPLPVK